MEVDQLDQLDRGAVPARTPTLPVPRRLLSDGVLARCVGRGDPHAFAVIYQRYHVPIYHYCCALVRDADDAHDALQATMVAALEGLRKIEQPVERLKPWLYRIAHNESISLLRRRKATVELETTAFADVSAQERAAANDRLAEMLADLAEMPARQSGALLLRELNGLGYDEIASVLGVSQPAARRAVCDARLALTECRTGREEICDTIRSELSHADGRVLRGRRVRAHLRDCAGCREFHASAAGRRRLLAGLPALGPAVPPASCVTSSRSGARTA